jgi:hypothetical protein
MYDEPEPVIVSLACAGVATRAMLATNALAARIALIFRIFSPCFTWFLNLRYVNPISRGLIACVYLLNGREIKGELLVIRNGR